MKILFSFDISDKHIESLKNSFSNIEIVKSEDKEVLSKEIKDADVFAAMLMKKFDSELIKMGDNLKWIQSWSAGIDRLLKDNMFGYLKENEITLTTVRGIHKDSMAEQIIGYMISFSRRFPELLELQKNREWDRLKVDYLKDKTIAIFGLGAVGKEVAKRASVFKMDILGIKRNVKIEVPFVNKLFKPQQSKEILQSSDYVVVTLPLTDDTRGFFGLKEFEFMKNSAYFINVSRGEVVKEKELIKALQKNIIAGAALDVYEKEPLPQNSHLYDLENVILTPHTSGLFPHYNKEALKIFKNNLKLFLEREELVNIVDLDRQY